MKILTLNVRGLRSTLEPSRLDRHRGKNQRFWNIVHTESPEILCLTETKCATTYKTEIPDDNSPEYILVAFRLAKQVAGGKSGSPSGGLAIYRRKDTTFEIEEKSIELCPIDGGRGIGRCSTQICEFCRYFIAAMMKFDDTTLNICLVYFPPYQSANVPEKNPFDVLQRVLKMNGGVGYNALIVGDFNARTGKCGTGWRSRDIKSNTYGRRLNKLCVFNKLVRLNGATPRDHYGEYTSTKGPNKTGRGKAVVDYAFMKRGTCARFDYDFRVMRDDDARPSADHRAIIVTVAPKRESPSTSPSSDFISGGFTPGHTDPPTYDDEDLPGDDNDYGDPAFDDDY